DFNLGCSGFVYGLGLADGLIRSGAAKRVLFITAETYSKYINADDRSLRTIFGDGAAATLIEAAPQPSLSGFCFGTDGSGADALLVNTGGARPSEQAIQPRKRQRWSSPLFMDGPALVDFTLERIPGLIDQVLASAQLRRDEIDMFLMHQATNLLLSKLGERLQLDATKMPMALANYGNTVSSTLPILLNDLRTSGRLRPGSQVMLIGYGVGFSWAGCVWRETWAASAAKAGDKYAAA
ncbi:MAG TPA: ketoacyl-ACP synthase III, partial [Pirellulales bacterium]|nr:ketoacyl-ACP synthase III [Pirellulales bacterium]